MQPAILKILRDRGMSFHFAPALAVCWSAEATRRRRSILQELAGLYPAGVICEIMNDDGTMARVPDLIHFCKRHRLLMITVAELARYRLDSEYEELLIATPDVFPMTVGKSPIELGSLL